MHKYSTFVTSVLGSWGLIRSSEDPDYQDDFKSVTTF